MKKQYFIFQHRQIGNVGAWELPKLDNQPKEGFEYESHAINWLNEKFKDGKEYGFRAQDHAVWHQFIVLPVYSKAETKQNS